MASSLSYSPHYPVCSASFSPDISGLLRHGGTDQLQRNQRMANRILAEPPISSTVVVIRLTRRGSGT